ncbi:unnamed protein product, partial [Pylaiella littoralis]
MLEVRGREAGGVGVRVGVFSVFLFAAPILPLSGEHDHTKDNVSFVIFSLFFQKGASDELLQLYLFFFRKRCVMTCSCDCIQRVCGERARLRVCVCGAGDGFRVSFLFAKFVVALYAYGKSRLFWWARTRQYIIVYQTSCFHGGCISLDELNYFGSAACRCCWLCVSWGVFSVCPVR